MRLRYEALALVQVAPERFSERTLEELSDVRNELLLSAASVWEIAIKYSIGKLPLPAPPAEYVPSRMLASGTKALPVLPTHAVRVASLPLHHRDPFDRMLVAQAQHEGVPLVTADSVFRDYDVELRSP